MIKQIKRLLSNILRPKTSNIEIILNVDYESWEQVFALAQQKNMKGFCVEIDGAGGRVQITFISIKKNLEDSWKLPCQRND